MKKLVYIFLTLVLGVQAASAGVPQRMELSGGWEFRQCGSGLWQEASVPGCVHTDLMALGQIDDPYYGRNEKSLQWIGEKDWEYRKTFAIDAGQLASGNVDLVLESVDTYAEIFVNGHRVGFCDNMFRTWRFDVRDFIKEGENEIVVFETEGFDVPVVEFLAEPDLG